MAYAAWRLWFPLVVLLPGGAASGGLWYSARQEAAGNAQALLISEARHFGDLAASKVESLEYQDAAPAAAERERLAAAQMRSDPIVSDLHEDSAGGRSAIVYVPLFAGRTFDGFITAELDLRRLFSEIFARSQFKNAVSVRRGDTPIVASGTPQLGAADGISGTATAPVKSLSFDIVMEPGADSLTMSGITTARYILMAGFFVTVLAAAARRRNCGLGMPS